jgi:hypothetical protein
LRYSALRFTLGYETNKPHVTTQQYHDQQQRHIHLVRKPPSQSHHRLASDECSCILDIEAFLHGSGRIVALPIGTLASRRESVCRDAAVFSGHCRMVGAAAADPRLQVPQQGSQEAVGADNEARQKGILQGKGINEGGILDEQGQVRAGSPAAVAVGGPGLDGLQGTHAFARNPEMVGMMPVGASAGVSASQLRIEC